MSKKSRRKKQDLDDYLVRLGVERPQPTLVVPDFWTPPIWGQRTMQRPIERLANRPLERGDVWDTAMDNAARRIQEEIDSGVMRELSRNIRVGNIPQYVYVDTVSQTTIRGREVERVWIDDIGS